MLIRPSKKFFGMKFHTVIHSAFASSVLYYTPKSYKIILEKYS